MFNVVLFALCLVGFQTGVFIIFGWIATSDWFIKRTYKTMMRITTELIKENSETETEP